MKKDNIVELENTTQSACPLEEICREGARQLLAQAIQTEVGEYLAQAVERDEHGRRMVTRNGYLPKRQIVTGMGPIEVQQPRVKDKREGQKFTSSILPPFMRRVPSLDALIPALYLKGVSTGDFSEALEAILGPQAAGLSPKNITRLKEGWQKDYETWSKRSLVGKRYVYVWADGIYFGVRLTKERPCLLVLMGALEDGRKELIGIWDGERESALSWKELFLDLKGRGFEFAPQGLAVGDGALGFWKALEESFPQVVHQRCWVHKTANILNKLPKSLHPSAKERIREIYMSESKEDAEKALEAFIDLYGAKYPKACDCLLKDSEELLAFYAYPAEHWGHIRTTNPIESTFATVRHRTRQTKGCGSRKATLSMAFKLCLSAEKRWRRLRGSLQLEKVVRGVQFADGIEKVNTEEAA